MGQIIRGRMTSPRESIECTVLRQWHDAMPADMIMLVEYKPFEPAFYHTDIADWGMAYVYAKDAGPRESAGSTRVTICTARMLSRSWRFFSTRECSADSTSRSQVCR